MPSHELPRHSGRGGGDLVQSGIVTIAKLTYCRFLQVPSCSGQQI